MNSAFIDSIKLILSDKYDISDKDYMTLSDILLSKGLSNVAFDGGLVEIVKLMGMSGNKFPISITYLQELWESENIGFNFVRMIGELVKNKVVSLRKVSKEVFLKSDNITKSANENPERDMFVVVYGTKDFNEILAVFLEVLNRSQSASIVEGAGASSLPKPLRGMLDKTQKLLKGMRLLVEVESFTSDDALGTTRLNLNISNTSDYSKYKPADLVRIAKKSVKGVSNIEIYREDSKTVFIGFDVNNSIDSISLRKLAEGIYNCFEVLEVGEE